MIRARSVGCLGTGLLALGLFGVAARQASETAPAAAASVGGPGHSPAPPAALLSAFEAAAHHHHVPVALLLAVGAVESSFQPDARSSAGAVGLMQMLPATFAEYAPPGSAADAIWDPATEIDAAAADLATNGAASGDGAGLDRALLAYDHDPGYVREVEERQAAYQAWIDAGMPPVPAALPWPLRGPITQGFGCTGVVLEPPRGSCPHFHTGIDIAAADGTAVAAACSGMVVQAVDEATGFGIHVVVACDTPGADVSTLYGHLAARVVQAGERVGTGQLLGYEGSTGNSTGPHLHFEIDTPHGPIDPLTYLGA